MRDLDDIVLDFMLDKKAEADAKLNAELERKRDEVQEVFYSIMGKDFFEVLRAWTVHCDEKRTGIEFYYDIKPYKGLRVSVMFLLSGPKFTSYMGVCFSVKDDEYNTKSSEIFKTIPRTKDAALQTLAEIRNMVISDRLIREREQDLL